MVRCEQLRNKAYKLLEQAKKCSGVMRSIWLSKYYQMKEIIENSTIEELSKQVN